MYHKIQGLYKRYREGENKGKFIIGDYSIPEFELLKDITWEFTEKLDGTNMRIIFNRSPESVILGNKQTIKNEERIEIKGKSEKSQLNKELVETIRSSLDVTKFLYLFPVGADAPEVCIYGEGLSHKIQKGGKYFKEGKGYKFIAFDINIGVTWMDRETVETMCNQLGIPVAPVVGRGTIADAIAMVKKGLKSTYGDFIAEGLVIRPVYELKDRRAHRIITKIKTRDFKEGEE